MKLHKLLSVCLIVGLLGFGVMAHAEYYVYGGQSFSSNEPDYWEKGYHPEDYDYDLLGFSDKTDTFNGAYSFYIITTYPVNIASVDTVQGSNGLYFGTCTTGNTIDHSNIGGAPDGYYALVGGQYDGSSGGFIVIDASYYDLSSITVYINENDSDGDDCKAIWEDNILTVPCVEFIDRDGNVRSGSYESLVPPRRFLRGFTEAE